MQPSATVCDSMCICCLYPIFVKRIACITLLFLSPVLSINTSDFTPTFLCSEQKCIRNQKHAAENGLPILKNVLLPKTRGFCACLEELRGCLDAGCLTWLYIFLESYSTST